MAIGSTIPSKVIDKVTPVILNNMDKLQDLGMLLLSKCNNLPLKVNCNDPRITAIKKLLAQIQKFLKGIKKLIAVIKKIIKALKIVKATASAIEIAQLVLPLPPFAPQGPMVRLLTIVTKLKENLKSAMPCFLAIIDIISLTVNDINSALAISLMILGGICVNEEFEISDDVNTLLKDRTTNTSTSATSVNNNGDSLITNTTNNTYDPSNASDEDLNEYIDLLNGIANELADPTKASIYLEEAPSLVYSGNGAPDLATGKLGDYYVDLSNSSIYGPKTTDTSWS